MKVIDLIRKAGAKAGLLQVAEEVRTVEIKIVEKKIVSLKELQSETEKETLAEMPAEITISFDRVFEALNLPVPEHGWTAEKVAQLLHSDEIKSKAHKEAAEAILVILGQNQVKPNDILQDALNRDHALDSYENFVEKKMQERSAARKKAETILHQRIQECEDEIRKLEAAQTRDAAALSEWQAQKVAKEEELARVASLFLQDHGITVGNNKKKE